MDPANDKGPPRYVARDAIDVRELAEHFGIDEDSMRDFCLKHEEEISAAASQGARGLLEEIGYLEGLIPLTVHLEPLPDTVAALAGLDEGELEML